MKFEKRYFMHIIIALLFITGAVAYLKIPYGLIWTDVERIVVENGVEGQQVVFCPSYLLNFAKDKHMGRFTSFDCRKSVDVCSSHFENYWMIGFCEEDDYVRKWVVGSINVYLMEFSGFEPCGFSLTEHFTEGDVKVVFKDSVRECSVYENGFDCGLASWMKITREYGFVDGKPQYCIFTHPQQGGELVLNWNGLPPGVLKMGFFDSAANQHVSYYGDSVDDKVYFSVGGREYVIDRDNRLDEVFFEGGDLEVRVRADDVSRKHVCMNLESDSIVSD